VHDRLAHRLQDRLTARERLVRPADHEGERPGFGAGHAARNRRIEHCKPRLARRRADSTGTFDIDGR
jgi:hypothetical protein